MIITEKVKQYGREGRRMRYAMKNKGKIVKAYELGDGTEMEHRMIREGAIQRIDQYTYRLFSKEAVNGTGQEAKAGDYFKVNEEDGKFYAYPNERAWFLQNHRHRKGDEYEQKCFPLPVWAKGDPACEAINYLLDSGRLCIDEGNREKYYNAELWGTMLSAPEDAVIVFYSIDQQNGQIQNIGFNFVDRKTFDRDYTVLQKEESFSRQAI